MPTHQSSEHGTFRSLYHAPGVAPFAKNTIILSRRGTLELRVHWFKFNENSCENKKETVTGLFSAMSEERIK